MAERPLTSQYDRESFQRKLNWLISLRLLFALLLLGSTVAYQIFNHYGFKETQIIFLYSLSGAMILLSASYGLMTPIARRSPLPFVYFQICGDAIGISFIVFITGGYASVFSFLYLMVVIYSSVFVLKRGTLSVALFCCLQYALLLILELNGQIAPFGYESLVVESAISGVQVFQKSVIMAVACFLVAFLSGYLSDQERQSKAELVAMEAHLDRVQSLAQIGEMAAGLAHEIKNPLASLSGAIQLLKGEMNSNPDSKRLMQIVLRETDRLSSLVNNFLTFARPSAGQTKAVDLAASLTDLVMLFEKDESVGERIHIKLITMENAFIEIDPMQLRQVVWNLLLNGAESIEGQGSITISVKPKKNRWITVEIADDGCGMGEETMKTIFNPFYTTKPNGTGLGLSIVYRILETYGCRLDVQSKPGLGSVFSVYFKLINPPRDLPSTLSS